MNEEIKNKIIELLLSTGRQGMKELLVHMEDKGFFTAPCSGQYHLAKIGGLAEHSLNVYKTACEVHFGLNLPIDSDSTDSLRIVTLIHDLGKMGHHNKPNYVPCILKSGKPSAKPFETNKELLYVPHEIESLAIASRFIELTEEEEFAILHHNGMYGDLKYQLTGKETPLQMLLHFADMWASRVIEKEDK